jgi:hypothetical protein
MSVRRVELKIFDDDEHITDPAYILKIPLPSLNELILLQLLEEILNDCFNTSRISTYKLEEELNKIKSGYTK